MRLPALLFVWRKATFFIWPESRWTPMLDAIKKLPWRRQKRWYGKYLDVNLIFIDNQNTSYIVFMSSLRSTQLCSKNRESLCVLSIFGAKSL